MNKFNASKSMLVHDGEIEGKEMHGFENEGKEISAGKETEVREIKARGSMPAPPPGGQEDWPKGRRSLLAMACGMAWPLTSGV